MITDVHAPLHTRRVDQLLRTEGAAIGIEVVPGEAREDVLIAGQVRSEALRPVLSDVAARLAHMDATGVEVQLLSGWVDLTAYAQRAKREQRMRGGSAGYSWKRQNAPRSVPRPGGGSAADTRSSSGGLAHAVTELGMVGGRDSHHG